MIGQARHSGAGSGCQGCDPEVKMPAESDKPFLCMGCIVRIQNEAGVNPGQKGIDMLRKLREQTLGEVAVT